jgi:hypothetical protein
MTQGSLLAKLVDPLNKINSEFLYYKENDYKNIIDLLSIICKSIEVCENIRFNRIEVISDEEKLNKLKRNIDIEDTRLMKVICYFNLLNEKGENIKQENGEDFIADFKFFIPKLLDGNKFILKGVEYTPLIQVIDYKPVINKDRITIKTTINKLIITTRKLRNIVRNYEVNLFSKIVPLLHIIFSMRNPLELITEKFKGKFEITDKKKYNNPLKSIKVGNQFINIDLDLELRENSHAKYLALMLSNSKKIKSVDLFKTSDYFIKQLGSKFTTNTNTYEDKGRKILYSLNRILDDISKRFLDTDNLIDLILSEIERQENYNDSQMNLFNKRIRFSEWVLYPLSQRLSDNLYIYLNSNHKNENKLKNVFKIDPYIVINYLLKSELCRYDDQTNSLDIISRTKGTFLGGSISGMTNNVPAGLRMIDETYIGRIDVISSPTGDGCGLTFQLTPMNSNIVSEKGTFQEREIDVEKFNKFTEKLTEKGN